jgi:hypothetical protein
MIWVERLRGRGGVEGWRGGGTQIILHHRDSGTLYTIPTLLYYTIVTLLIEQIEELCTEPLI